MGKRWSRRRSGCFGSSCIFFQGLARGESEQEGEEWNVRIECLGCVPVVGFELLGGYAVFGRGEAGELGYCCFLGSGVGGHLSITLPGKVVEVEKGLAVLEQKEYPFEVMGWLRMCCCNLWERWRSYQFTSGDDRAPCRAGTLSEHDIPHGHHLELDKFQITDKIGLSCARKSRLLETDAKSSQSILF